MDLKFEIYDLILEVSEAHICDIWALLIICGSVVVISVATILQTKCMADISYCRLICDLKFVICNFNAPLAVDLGGVA